MIHAWHHATVNPNAATSTSSLAHSYSPSLVFLSIVIAIFASYSALDLAGRTSASEGRLRFIWIGTGASALGLGIWSMHYIGMLALTLPVRVLYDLPTVLLSLLAAVFASAVALFFVSRAALRPGSVLVSSLVMGAGISAMHYIGMAAMRLPAACVYDLRIVAASFLIAIVVSVVALLVAFRLRNTNREFSSTKIAAAIVMGFAIASMHYTGMAAVSFFPVPLTDDISHSIEVTTIGAFGVAIITGVVLGVVTITSVLDRKFSPPRPRSSPSATSVTASSSNARCPLFTAPQWMASSSIATTRALAHWDTTRVPMRSSLMPALTSSNLQTKRIM